MGLLALVLTIALCVVAVFVGLFVWAVRSGQLDDLETPAERMLHADGEELPAARAPAGPRDPPGR